jgi:hypothetical protein
MQKISFDQLENALNALIQCILFHRMIGPCSFTDSQLALYDIVFVSKESLRKLANDKRSQSERQDST